MDVRVIPLKIGVEESVKKRAELVVNLAILKRNYSLIESLCPDKKMIIMIKANAYGHGDTEVYQALKGQASLDGFGVASIEEALSLRKRTSCFQKPIIVFSDLFIKDNGYAKSYAENKIIPVISDFQALEYFLTSDECKGVPLFLKFNTGMNRLGFKWEDISRLSSMLKSNGRKQIDHLMTHFSDASMPIESSIKTQKQLQLFEDIKKYFTSCSIEIRDTSTCNSSGILQGVGDKDSHVRPGLILYGPCDSKIDFRWEGQMVSKLRVHKINSFDAKKGDEIGYGSSICKGSGKIHVLAIGYGDGFSTNFSGKKIPLAFGDVTVVGRVNMDMMLIMPEKDSKKLSLLKDCNEEFVDIWGESQKHFNSLSLSGGVLNYELLCGLSERVSRVYIDKQQEECL